MSSESCVAKSDRNKGPSQEASTAKLLAPAVGTGYRYAWLLVDEKTGFRRSPPVCPRRSRSPPGALGVELWWPLLSRRRLGLLPAGSRRSRSARPARSTDLCDLYSICIRRRAHSRKIAIPEGQREIAISHAGEG